MGPLVEFGKSASQHPVSILTFLTLMTDSSLIVQNRYWILGIFPMSSIFRLVCLPMNSKGAHTTPACPLIVINLLLISRIQRQLGVFTAVLPCTITLVQYIRAEDRCIHPLKDFKLPHWQPGDRAVIWGFSP